MSEPVIKVSGLGKQYHIGGVKKTNRTLVETLSDTFRSPFRRGDDDPATSFWALKDVNFEIHQGEVVGVIGRNGAGKSTLLKILSRITDPTEGEIDITGRVGSLLEVGTGFHPELTGRENVYLNGAILGMKKADIAKRFDEIVAFAGTEKFLDTAVKYYSSGMYTRLAFAVAAHLEPEILIVDEVLAVGDAEFQKKCLGKMKDVAGHGRTVIFVSHNMAAVSTLCNKAIFLAKGAVVMKGDSAPVINSYIEAGRQLSGEAVWHDAATAPASEKLRLTAVRIVSNGEITADVDIARDVDVQVVFETLRPDLRVAVSVHLLDRMGTCIFATANMRSATPEPDPLFNVPLPAGQFRAVCRIPRNFLNEGLYLISAFLLTDVSNIEVQAAECVSFSVHETGEMRKEYSGGWIGMVRPKFAWHTEPVQQPPGLAATETADGFRSVALPGKQTV